jgi:hypothetical protein
VEPGSAPAGDASARSEATPEPRRTPERPQPADESSPAGGEPPRRIERGDLIRAIRGMSRPDIEQSTTIPEPLKRRILEEMDRRAKRPDQS